jgi:DNA-binding NtrC family response regulator
MVDAEPPRPCLLVVDDEPSVCESVRDLLRREFRVLTATGAEEGCRLLREQPVQVLLTDLRMPRVGGVELLEAARASNPEVVGLMFSGFADFESILAAINQGHVFEFLRKPWRPDDLLDAVRRAAAESRRRARAVEEARHLRSEVQTLRARVDQLESEVERLRPLEPGAG